MRRRHALLGSAAVAVLAAAGTAVTLPAAAASVGCSVSYTLQSQWSGGFTANVTVTNLGDALTQWSLGFDFPHSGQQVAQGWSATWSQAVSRVTATNAAWNGNLGPNASTTIGFLGAYTAANPVPTNFSLNGYACNGGTTTGSPTTPPTTAATTRPPMTTRATTPPTTRVTTPPTTVPVTTSPGDVLSQVHTVGRVKTVGNTMQVSWNGVYFEGRFRGTGVGVVLNDHNADYEIQIDGATAGTLLNPAANTYWVNGLSNTEHTVRLVKRSESPWSYGQFGGFVAASGGALLSKPAARSRQIEFIGDSYTAGYGNLSTVRDCNATGGINRNTNADIAFGALTAKGLNADYQINAWSGMGMVRNYNGQSPGQDYRTYYDRTLQAVSTENWPVPSTWRPQLVVVGLGINDFSTPLNPGEQWATQAALIAAYKTAYLGFLDKLRARYGPDTVIVVSATAVSGTTAFADAAQQIVQTRNSAGDSRVRYWYYDDPALDRLGCDWHPSARDHRIIAGLLGTYLAGLPLTW